MNECRNCAFQGLSPMLIWLGDQVQYLAFWGSLQPVVAVGPNLHRKIGSVEHKPLMKKFFTV